MEFEFLDTISINQQIRSLVKSTNNNDLEDKIKGTYQIAPGDFIETYGIVHIELGQFEVYIDLGKERAGDEGTDQELKYYQEQKEWSMNSSWLNAELSGLSLSAEANANGITTCEEVHN